jgi:hypothetical protein
VNAKRVVLAHTAKHGGNGFLAGWAVLRGLGCVLEDADEEISGGSKIRRGGVGEEPIGQGEISQEHADGAGVRFAGKQRQRADDHERRDGGAFGVVP